MKENIKYCASLISLAKVRLDHGFSQVGRSLKADNPVDHALMLLAGRSIAMGNALTLLAMHQHANEALPLLRSLLEIAVHMRWIVEKDSMQRAREFLKESRDLDWEKFWKSSRLQERIHSLGFGEALEKKVPDFCRQHVMANAAGLPWGHIFAESKDTGMAPEELLRLTAAIMGHVVKALDLFWPGKFAGADEIWEKAGAF